MSGRGTTIRGRGSLTTSQDSNTVRGQSRGRGNDRGRGSGGRPQFPTIANLAVAPNRVHPIEVPQAPANAQTYKPPATNQARVVDPLLHRQRPLTPPAAPSPQPPKLPDGANSEPSTLARSAQGEDEPGQEPVASGDVAGTTEGPALRNTARVDVAPAEAREDSDEDPLPFRRPASRSKRGIVEEEDEEDYKPQGQDSEEDNDSQRSEPNEPITTRTTRSKADSKASSTDPPATDVAPKKKSAASRKRTTKDQERDEEGGAETKSAKKAKTTTTKRPGRVEPMPVVQDAAVQELKLKVRIEQLRLAKMQYDMAQQGHQAHLLKLYYENILKYNAAWEEANRLKEQGVLPEDFDVPAPSFPEMPAQVPFEWHFFSHMA